MSDDRGELCPLRASLPLSEVPPNKAKALSDLWRVPERWSSLQQLECFLNPLLLLIQDSGTYTWMTKWPYCNIHGCSSWHLPWAGDHIDNQVEACCVLLLIWLLMSKLSVSPFFNLLMSSWWIAIMIIQHWINSIRFLKTGQIWNRIVYQCLMAGQMDMGHYYYCPRT